MITRKLLLGLILFSSIFLQVSCKKTDTLKSNGTESSHSMEKKFFGNHRSNDPTEVAFVEFLKRVNEKENFVEKTVMQIGYPRWDKTFIKPKNLPNLQQNLTGDSTEHYYIPFVRDSQHFVNAAMIITATPTDTSFSYRVDCDYRLQANSTTSVHDDAEYLAIFFMFMDKRVFGYQKFSIIDSNLFKENGNKATKIELTAAAANPTNGNLWDYVEFCQDVYLSSTNCDLYGLDLIPNCPIHISYSTFTYCWGEWIETGNGGGGGTTTTGGGGSTGSNTPPSSCQGGGGTGGGWTYIPSNEDPVPPTDTCEIAQLAARRLDTLFIQSKADSVLNSIPNLATDTIENGFVVFRRFNVHPHNVTDTTFKNYNTSEVFRGTDSSMNFSFIQPNLTVLAAFFHTHPLRGYAAQSASDIYIFIETSLVESHLVGNFIAAANGSQYGITITNPSQANAFLATKSLFLNGTKWDEESIIGKAFRKAKNYFEDKYDDNPNKNNLSYEMAMAAVLNQFNSGITLNKKDASGKFKPIVVKTTPDPQKPKKLIYTQECL